MYPNHHIVYASGMNGIGGQNIPHTMPHIEAKNTHLVKNPNSSDLGQANCIKELQTVLNTPELKSKDARIIFHGSSQGTATILNWLATATAEEVDKIDAIILEGILASGPITFNTCAWPVSLIPGLKYILPSLASMLLFRRHVLNGPQALTNAELIEKKIQSRNIPIILLNSETRDRETPFYGAEMVYAGLHANSDAHDSSVYLIPVKKAHHVWLLTDAKNKPKYFDQFVNLLQDHPTSLENEEIDKESQTPYLSSVHEILAKYGKPFHKAYINSTNTHDIDSAYKPKPKYAAYTAALQEHEKIVKMRKYIPLLILFVILILVIGTYGSTPPI